MPDTSVVLCVREDLLRRTGFFDSAIWRWDPPGLQARPTFTLLLGTSVFCHVLNRPTCKHSPH